MAFQPNQFLSNIKAKGGLAKPSRFQVVLPIPTYINSFVGQSIFEKLTNLPATITAELQDIFATERKDAQSRTANPTLSRYLGLQCESSELPGKTLVTADAKVYGPTYKVPYQTQYNETTLTFVCTNDFYERKLFDRWIESIMPTDTNNLRFAKDDTTRYMTNIQVLQYDDFVKQIYAVEMIDAYPIGISAQPLSWSEDGFHRVSVQFTYQRFRTIYDSRINIADQVAEKIGGSLGERLLKPINQIDQAITQKVGNIATRVLL
jgi:hypothetical protein